MPQLKRKITLEKQGDEAYISVRQLICTLRWTKSVDLDLMAFYRAKDGRTGGIISNNYPGGSMGSLNVFPFIQLSGDAGLDARGGDNEEVLRITRLDDMAEVYICTLNYTDASMKRDITYASYDGTVTVMDDRGESVEVPLNSRVKGHIAVIARIENSSMMGARLINENRVMDLNTFAASIPGANVIFE